MALDQTEEMSIRNPDLMHLVNLKSKGTNLDPELGHLWGKIRMDKEGLWNPRKQEPEQALVWSLRTGQNSEDSMGKRPCSQA